jgi:hypothetical protein
LSVALDFELAGVEAVESCRVLAAALKNDGARLSPHDSQQDHVVVESASVVEELKLVIASSCTVLR